MLGNCCFLKKEHFFKEMTPAMKTELERVCSVEDFDFASCAKNVCSSMTEVWKIGWRECVNTHTDEQYIFQFMSDL